MQVLSFYFPTPGSRQLMCWAELNCLRYDPVWFVGEFLRVSCCGLRDILWAINQRLATQWEGIQHNFPVGLRRYEPSISTVGKAADLESLLLMWYVQLCVCECLSVCHFFFDWRSEYQEVLLDYVLQDNWKIPLCQHVHTLSP